MRWWNETYTSRMWRWTTISSLVERSLCLNRRYQMEENVCAMAIACRGVCEFLPDVDREWHTHVAKLVFPSDLIDAVRSQTIVQSLLSATKACIIMEYISSSSSLSLSSSSSSSARIVLFFPVLCLCIHLFSIVPFCSLSRIAWRSPHLTLFLHTFIHRTYIHTYIISHHCTCTMIPWVSIIHTHSHTLSLSRVCVCGEQQQQAPSHREDCTNTYTYILNQRERERECVCVRTQRIHQKRRLSTIQDVMSMST